MNEEIIARLEEVGLVVNSFHGLVDYSKARQYDLSHVAHVSGSNLRPQLKHLMAVPKSGQRAVSVAYVRPKTGLTPAEIILAVGDSGGRLTVPLENQIVWSLAAPGKKGDLFKAVMVRQGITGVVVPNLHTTAECDEGLLTPVQEMGLCGNICRMHFLTVNLNEPFRSGQVVGVTYQG